MANGSSVATEGVEVLVIGGGQAGLAMGHHLAKRGLAFVIADANPEVGHMWRARWQSLKLFTAGQYNNLPGMDFPAARDAYPGKDSVADFLQSYAEKFALPVRLNTTVTRLTRADNGGYLAETTTGPIRAERVVVATGPFQVPFTPAFAEQLDPELTQLHSASYQGPDDLPDGRILVVGGANSGQQIALELSDSRRVDIAVGEKLPTLPQRPLGRDIWWWLTATRLARTITFDDGESADYDGVVWATGFRLDHSWIDVPEVKDGRGQVQHLRGVTEAPGLYLLGMTWQYTRTSALLGWVGDDAAFVADQIESAKQAPARSESLARTTS